MSAEFDDIVPTPVYILTNLYEQFIKDGVKILKNTFLELFANNPNIKYVTWNQRVEYYDDNHYFVFGVYCISICDFSDRRVYLKNKYEVNVKGILQSSASEIILKNMFGDNVTVTATKEGFEIKECFT